MSLAVVGNQQEIFDDQPDNRWSVESEMAVLGTLLVNPELLPQARQLIQPTDFYRKAHEYVFSAMIDLADDEVLCEIVAVGDRLRRWKKLEQCGGRGGLVDIAGWALHPGFFEGHLERIWDFAQQRKVQVKLREIGNEIATGEQSFSAIIGKARETLDEIDQQPRRTWDLGQILHEFSTLFELRAENEDAVGLKTRFGALDAITKGFRPGSLIVLGGRPSMGKTMFALNMLQNIACGKMHLKDEVENRSPKPVAFFSLEMTQHEVAERMLVRAGRFDASEIRVGKVNLTDWYHSIGLLEAATFAVFDGKHGISTITGIRAALSKLKVAGIEPSMIAVDYIQMMRGDGDPNKITNRNYEIEKISRGLKQIAIEFNCVVVALSQLGREVERRPDKRPQMSDLRDSGSLEQDADIVMFLYRDEKYNPNTPDKGLAELIIAKHRNGELGTCVLQYQPEYQSFWDSNLTTNDLISRQPSEDDKPRYNK